MTGEPPEGVDLEQGNKEEENDQGQHKDKVMESRVFPTPDEAEWASHVWNTWEALGGLSKTACEDLWESVRKLEELHREELQQLRPHQAEMACQFWALTGAGIKGPRAAA